MGEVIMKKHTKKTIAILLCLVFIISTVATSSAIKLDNKDSKDSIESSKKVQLIRFGPDGTTTPIEVDIDLNENQDEVELIIEKCKQLFSEDTEINDFLKATAENNDSNFSFGMNAFIVSKGRGFHFKTKLKIRFVIVNCILDKLLPWNRNKIFRRWVICNYKNDSRAKTTIYPNVLVNSTQVINGSHALLMNNFVGFALWSGRFDKSFLDILPRLIVGKAKFVVTYKN